MQTKVTVTATPEGLVVVPSANKAGTGYIRVEQTNLGPNSEGFVSENRKSTLLKGTIDVLNKLNYKKGSTLVGKLYIVETTVKPKWEGATPKINPKTGEILSFNGLPIYRDTKYDITGTKEDILIQHNTVPIIVEEPVVKAVVLNQY